jgi:ABC-type Fe3+ transport system substrate-binding protein
MTNKKLAFACRTALGAAIGVTALASMGSAALAQDRCDDPRVKYAIGEGELLVVASIFETPETQNAHEDAFKAYWCLGDDFDVKYQISNTPSMIARIEAEVDAGVPISGDVTTAPFITWLIGARDRGLLMAYDSPEYKHMELPEAIGLNDRPYWTSDMYMFVPMWNASCPGMEDIKIESWLDLLNPALKGQMAINDGSQQQSTALAFANLKERLPDGYFEDLAAQDLIITSTSLHGMEMLASCERPLYAMGVSADANVEWTKGNDWIRTGIPKEGVMLQEQATAIFADAPHPNASQLWVDFLRSEVGQPIFEKHEGRVPGRKGIPSSTPETTPNADTLFEMAFSPDYAALVRDPEFVRRAQEEWGEIFIK